MLPSEHPNDRRPRFLDETKDDRTCNIDLEENSWFLSHVLSRMLLMYFLKYSKPTRDQNRRRHGEMEKNHIKGMSTENGNQCFLCIKLSKQLSARADTAGLRKKPDIWSEQSCNQHTVCSITRACCFICGCGMVPITGGWDWFGLGMM